MIRSMILSDWQVRAALDRRLSQVRLPVVALEGGERWVPVSEDIPAEGEYVRVLAKGVRYHLGAWYWETPDHDEHENPEPYRQWEVFYDMENRMIPLDEPPTHFSRSPLPEPPKDGEE